LLRRAVVGFVGPCFVLLLFTERAAATPVTIFSDFGPGQSYTSGIGWTVSGLMSAGGYFQSVAMPISPSADYALSQIDIALSSATGTNSASVTLNEDSAGKPGTILLNWHLASLPAFGTCCIVTMLTPSSLTFLMAGAQYWLVASPGTLDAGLAWNLNNVGATGLVELNNGNGFFIPPDLTLGAFDVLGEAMGGPVTPVPEPGTVLLSVAILALMSRRRRKTIIPPCAARRRP
jgi:hypothetical protein